MNCLVTGGLGFIGSNLVDFLVDAGHKVTVFDNESSGKIEYFNPAANYLFQDVLSLKFFGEKYDVVFHLAAQSRVDPSIKSPIKTSEINIIGTMKALEFAKAAEARFVYAGSSSFYGDPHKNPYAISKWMGEEMCQMYNQLYGVPVVIARFFNVFGFRQPSVGENATLIGIFERQKMNNEPLTITGTGEQRRDFVHVFDIAEGLIAMSKQNYNGEIFNLGSGTNYSINEVAKMFKQKVEYIPARTGEAFETLADISLTKEKLNWQPHNSLPEYVESFVDFLPDKKYLKDRSCHFWSWFKNLIK